jgi:hypothetical protein
MVHARPRSPAHVLRCVVLDPPFPTLMATSVRCIPLIAESRRGRGDRSVANAGGRGSSACADSRSRGACESRRGMTEAPAPLDARPFLNTIKTRETRSVSPKIGHERIITKHHESSRCLPRT